MRIDLDLVVRGVEGYRDFAVRFLGEIVSIPTVSPWGEGYEEFARVSREFLESVGISVEIHRVPQEYVDPRVPPEGRGRARYIVLARIGSRDNVAIHFNGHYDVVPGGPGWRITEPFKPKIVDGKLYGRGSTDMKGGIAAIATAMASLSKHVDHLGIGVEAVFVPDEEILGSAGTGYVVEKGMVRSRYVVIAEPSGLGQMYIGHKGALWGEVTVRGKTSHGSMPWLGVNAFDKATLIARKMFDELVPRIEAKKSKYTYDLEEGNKATIMIGGYLRGGKTINQVPGEVAFSFDRRLIVEESSEDAWREIREFVENTAKNIGADIEVRLINKVEPVIVDPSLRIFNTIERGAEKILGKRPRKVICRGATDMRFYAAAGYEVVTYGPGVVEIPHMPDEYIEIEDMMNASKIYSLLPLILTHEKS